MKFRHTLLLAAGLLLACDITQEHIDEASERLAEATVATGSPPTAAQVAAAEPLQRQHLAGSTWRLIEVSKWPHADWVVTLGSNGRLVWHVTPAYTQHWTHWNVAGGSFSFSGGDRGSSGPIQGRRVDVHTICLADGGPCEMVLQRVTP